MEEELKKEIEELKSKMDEMDLKISEITRRADVHKHDGIDSSRINNDIKLKPLSFFTVGNSQMTDYDTGVATRMFFETGPNLAQSFTKESQNSQITFEHGKTNGLSFFYGFRPPLYSGTITDDGSGNSVTATASVVGDTTRAWTTNELADAIVNIYDSSGTFVHASQIASNTATIITIEDTWATTVTTGGSYVVFVPIYLGSADFPWHRGYFTGTQITATGSQRKALQFGRGASGGTKVVTINYGEGTPESSITANIGSLFMRTDGGAGTSLYIKETGTGNTGWAGV